MVDVVVGVVLVVVVDVLMVLVIEVAVYVIVVVVDVVVVVVVRFVDCDRHGVLPIVSMKLCVAKFVLLLWSWYC